MSSPGIALDDADTPEDYPRWRLIGEAGGDSPYVLLRDLLDERRVAVGVVRANELSDVWDPLELPSGIGIVKGATDDAQVMKVFRGQLRPGFSSALSRIQKDSVPAELESRALSACVADELLAGGNYLSALLAFIVWSFFTLVATVILGGQSLSALREAGTIGSSPSSTSVRADVMERLLTSFAWVLIAFVLFGAFFAVLWVQKYRPERPDGRVARWFARRWWVVRAVSFSTVIGMSIGILGFATLRQFLLGAAIAACLWIVVVQFTNYLIPFVASLVTVRGSDPRARVISRCRKWILQLEGRYMDKAERQGMIWELLDTARYFELYFPLTGTNVYAGRLRQALEVPAGNVAAALRDIAVLMHLRPQNWTSLAQRKLLSILIRGCAGDWTSIAAEDSVAPAVRHGLVVRLVKAGLIVSIVFLLPLLPTEILGVPTTEFVVPIVLAGLLSFFGSSTTTLVDKIGGAFAKGR